MTFDVFPRITEATKTGRPTGTARTHREATVAEERPDERVAESRDASMRERVRILGTRLGRFVEFEFSIGDDDLAVELILPTRAFEEFCRTRGAVVLPPDPATAEALEQMAWRAGQPGLLRRTTPEDREDEPEGAETEPRGRKR